MRRATTHTNGGSGRGSAILAKALLSAGAIALLSGCAQRDSVTVGSIPDDYRTNHPIIVAEREESIDLPVGTSDYGMNSVQRVAVLGFVSDYDRSAAATVTILVPANAANSAAASSAAHEIAQYMYRNGIPSGHIVTTQYDAGAPTQAAPIRISYPRMSAFTDKCGRWPADLNDTTQNKHYANFGCAYQNNLAAQIDNPADLLGPRKQTEIDAANREVAIGVYQRSPEAASNRTTGDWTANTRY